MERTLSSALLCVCCVAVQPLFAYGEELSAGFTAEEALEIAYSQGFDSEQEFGDWSLESAGASSIGWGLAEKPYYKDIPAFSSIDSGSKMSMAIAADYVKMQKAYATSPAVAVPEKAWCEFYACFGDEGLKSSIWNFKVCAEDCATGAEIVLFDASEWAQAGNKGREWRRFSFDLSGLSGTQLRFCFDYWGLGGDDVFIDAFRVIGEGLEPVAVVSVGEPVHFIDRSQGSPDSWSWQFEGGTPSASDAPNPVVSYASPGEYPVSLAVAAGGMVSECTVPAFVKVKPVLPNAGIGLPGVGYLSPAVECFVPVGVDVEYSDMSTGAPDAWVWHLPGCVPDVVSEQNPVVRYLEPGIYDVALSVSNGAGSDEITLEKAVQAGGSQEIWNIPADKRDCLAPVDLGFYGYYAGTNWLGMVSFAEKFKKPCVKANIEKVAVYFASSATISPEAEIKVSISKADSGGFPGEELGCGMLRAGDLSETGATVFEMQEPVCIDDEFFVVVSGIPNDAAGRVADDIAILCLRYGDGEEGRAYHYLEDGNGGSCWYENTDDPVSLAVAPVVSFDTDSGVDSVAGGGGSLLFDGLVLRVSGMAERIVVVDLSGSVVFDSVAKAVEAELGLLPAGIYVAKAGSSVLKIIRR